MKVINLNSTYVLSDGHLAFAERLVHSLSSHLGPGNRLAQLLDDIPIFLVDDAWMKKYNDNDNENENGHGHVNERDLLGFYLSASTILDVDKSVIGLCPERILASAALGGRTPTDNQITWLVGKVLIHELGHALMHEETQLKRQERNFYRFMEEAMANVITLTAFESLGTPYSLHSNRPSILAGGSPLPLQYVRTFIAKQPPEYRLALDLHDENVGWWWIWQSFKRNHSNCNKLPSAEINNFITVVTAKKIKAAQLRTSVESLLVWGEKS